MSAALNELSLEKLYSLLGIDSQKAFLASQSHLTLLCAVHVIWFGFSRQIRKECLQTPAITRKNAPSLLGETRLF